MMPGARLQAIELLGRFTAARRRRTRTSAAYFRSQRYRRHRPARILDLTYSVLRRRAALDWRIRAGAGQGSHPRQRARPRIIAGADRPLVAGQDRRRLRWWSATGPEPLDRAETSRQGPAGPGADRLASRRPGCGWNIRAGSRTGWKTFRVSWARNGAADRQAAADLRVNAEGTRTGCDQGPQWPPVSMGDPALALSDCLEGRRWPR